MPEIEDQDPPTSQRPSWEDRAREEQQNFLELLGTRKYDCYKRKMPSICNLLLTGFCKCHENDGMCVNESEMVALKMKIGFALCGQPTEPPANENSFTGYTAAKLQLIIKVFDQIVRKQQNDKVLMITIFISLEKNDGSGDISNCPVFRVPNPNNEEAFCFVDSFGRFYNDWDGFLHNNKLYKSKVCYPKDGIYCGNSEGKVEVEFGWTPAATLKGRIVNYMDTSATVGSVAAGVCVFIPPVAVPGFVAGGLFALYGTARGSMELADRSSHGQSLTDREAGLQWLSLAGTVLGLGSAGATTALRMAVMEGKVVSGIVTGIVTCLSASSLLANGACIVGNALTIHEQEEWLSLQSFQLVVSVYFFSHSMVNFKTARTLIVETQNQVLNDHGSGLTRRQRNLFSGMQRETLNAEPDPVIGRAKIIKDLNHISNKSEFFGQILQEGRQARKTSQPTQKLKFGNLGGLQEGPSSLVQTTSSHQNVFPRQTAAPAPTMLQAGTSFGDAPTRCVRPFEPALVTQIRDLLRHISSSGALPNLLTLLDKVCENFKYGALCMSAIRIILKMYDCRNANEAMHILEEVLNLWKMFVEERRQSRSSPEPVLENDEGVQEGPMNEPLGVEEIMNEIVQDVDFVPEHFYCLGGVEIDEEVYHFPVDHREWGVNGELSPEDYVLIAQNAFGANTPCNIRHQGNTANVFVENFGLVKISSSVQENLIILKKFKNLQ